MRGVAARLGRLWISTPHLCLNHGCAVFLRQSPSSSAPLSIKCLPSYTLNFWQKCLIVCRPKRLQIDYTLIDLEGASCCSCKYFSLYLFLSCCVRLLIYSRYLIVRPKWKPDSISSAIDSHTFLPHLRYSVTWHGYLRNFNSTLTVLLYANLNY